MNIFSLAYCASIAAFMMWGVASPVAALEVCASVGKIDIRTDRTDPCQNLSDFAQVVGKCAAEITEDRQLQRHAARILQLERQTPIDESVFQSLSKMRENSGATRGTSFDPPAFDRQMATQESLGEKNRKALTEVRSTAVSAGYPKLDQRGYAQLVTTNAVWRSLDSLIRPQVVNCRGGEEGLASARNVAGMLAVSISHGNLIETQIIRQLLENQQESR